MKNRKQILTNINKMSDIKAPDPKEESLMLTASVISYNLFDYIKNFKGSKTLDTHEKIIMLAFDFEEEHSEIEFWEDYFNYQHKYNTHDWEEYLIFWTKDHL